MKEIMSAKLIQPDKGFKVAGCYQGIRVTEGEYGTQKVHRLDTKDGPVEMYGCKQLDQKLGFVKQGDTVQLTYQGKVKNADKSGSEHTWKVEVE